MFVGRARELGELRAEQRRSEQGELRVAVVLGDGGLGKTRLAAEVFTTGPDPVLTLTGRSSRLVPTPPFARWTAALGGPAASAGEIVDLLGDVSAHQPVVIVLDDAHWAGEDFWAMVLTLSEEHAGSRLFVLATARAGQLAGNRAATEVLSVLEQEGTLRRVRLGPLRREEVAELALATIGLGAAPTALVDWLMVRSLGVPRFAAGLVKAVVQECADPLAPAFRDVPEELARWVHAELAQLEATTFALLELLAVVDSPVDPSDLAIIASMPAEDVAASLERLVQLGMVLEHEHAGLLGYEIAHPLIKEVLYGSLGGARRRILHHRAAGMLMTAGRAEAATLHLLRSARAGSGVAPESGIAEAKEAIEEGSRAMPWAIVPTLVDDIPSEDSRWPELLAALSWPESTVRYPVERYTPTQVKTVLPMLEQLARADRGDRHAGIGHRAARASSDHDDGDHGGGDAGTARSLGGTAELRRRAGRDHESRMAAIELAKMRGWSGDVPGQETEGRTLLREAEEAGDRGAMVGAIGTLGLALGLQGRFSEAEVVLLRGVELAPPADRAVVESQTNAVLASHDASRGHMSSARERWSRAARAGGSADASVRESGAFLALLRGELATLPDRAQRPDLDVPRQLASPWLVLFTAMAEAEHGRVIQARRRLDRIGRDYQGNDLDLFSQFRRWGEGVVAWAEDRLPAAIAVLQRAVERCVAMSAYAVVGFILADLAEVAAVAGDVHAAARAAASAEDVARRIGAPSYQALHHFTVAWSLLAMGRAEESEGAARYASDRLRAVGFPVLEARAHVATACATRTRNRASATDALVDAIAAFDACGACVRANRARALLTTITNGRRATGVLGGPPLTDREQQIAELASAGFTARQIGDRLHIGVRTVETHLARVYRKLGVGSKQQLVSRRTELGLATNP